MTFSSDQLLDASAIAKSHINKEIPDLMSKASIFWSKLYDNRKYVAGGKNLQFPVNHKEHSSQGFINGTTDTISLNPQQHFTYAALDWKYFYNSVIVTLDDITKTGDSPEAIVDLYVAKANAAKSSLARNLASAAHGTGSATNKSFTGLGNIFAASGTAYGGLTDTDFALSTSWLAELDSTTETVNYKNIAKNYGKLAARVQKQYNLSTGKEYKVDLMMSNYAVREEFIASEQVKTRPVDQKTLELGFDIVKFRNADWGVDEYCTGSADGGSNDNYLYMISSASIMFMYKYGLDDKTCPIAQEKGVVPNQPLMFNVGYIVGNIACENRRCNCLMSTLIA